MADTHFQKISPEKYLLDHQWQEPTPPGVPESALPTSPLTPPPCFESRFESKGDNESEGRSDDSDREQYSSTNGDAFTFKAQGQSAKTQTDSFKYFKESATSMLSNVAEELARLASEREMELRRELTAQRDRETETRRQISGPPEAGTSTTTADFRDAVTRTKSVDTSSSFNGAVKSAKSVEFVGKHGDITREKNVEFELTPATKLQKRMAQRRTFFAAKAPLMMDESLSDEYERFTPTGCSSLASSRQSIGNLVNVKRASRARETVDSKKEIFNYKGLMKILKDGDDRQDQFNGFRKQLGHKRGAQSQEFGKTLSRSATAWSFASSIGNATWAYIVGSLRRARQRKDSTEILLDQAMGIIIILNTITIGISCDVAEDSNGWLVLDSFYACIFLAETITKVRLLGHRVFWCGLNWSWNWLETLLVILAWNEIVIQIVNVSGDSDVNVSTLRTIRILRITRIVRVCRLPFMADLVMMINGAIGGMKTLIWSIFLIALPLYVVALLMRETIGRDDTVTVRDSFSTLPMSTFTLFRCIVAADCTDAQGLPIFMYTSGIYSMIYVVTMLLMTFGLFNVIVAIYVENTVAAAKYNELHQKRQRLRDNLVFARKACDLVEIVWEIFCEVQPDGFSNENALAAERLGCDPHAIEIVSEIGNFPLSLQFFEKLIQRHEFQEVLKDMDIADNDTLDLFETLDVDGSGSIDLAELLFGLRKLRGEPRRADVIANNLITRSILDECCKIEGLVTERRTEEKKLMGSLKQVLEKLVNANGTHGAAAARNEVDAIS